MWGMIIACEQKLSNLSDIRIQPYIIKMQSTLFCLSQKFIESYREASD